MKHPNPFKPGFRQHRYAARMVYLMVAIVLLHAILVALTGCTGKPGNSRRAAQAAPTPTTIAVTGSIAGAKADTKAAQANVKIGKAEAEKAGVVSASQPLTDADGQLTAALLKLEEATSHNAELQRSIDSHSEAAAAQVQALELQIRQLTNTVARLEKKNLDLKNEVLRRTKLTIGGVGAALLLGAAGSVAGFFFLGFTAGLRVAVVCAVMGATAITLATLLTQIVFWTAVSMGIGLLAAVIYAAWKVFHHVPTRTLGLKPLEPIVRLQA